MGGGGGGGILCVLAVSSRMWANHIVTLILKSDISRTLKVSCLITHMR